MARIGLYSVALLLVMAVVAIDALPLSLFLGRRGIESNLPQSAADVAESVLGRPHHVPHILLHHALKGHLVNKLAKHAKGVLEEVKNTGDHAGETASDLVKDVSELDKRGLFGFVHNLAGGASNLAKNVANTGAHAIGNIAHTGSNLAKNVVGTGANLAHNLVGTGVNLANNAAGTASNLAQNAVGAGLNLAGNVANTAGNVAGNLANTAVNLGKNVVDTGANLASNLIGTGTNFVQNAAGTAGELGLNAVEAAHSAFYKK